MDEATHANAIKASWDISLIPYSVPQSLFFLSFFLVPPFSADSFIKSPSHCTTASSKPQVFFSEIDLFRVDGVDVKQETERN